VSIFEASMRIIMRRAWARTRSPEEADETLKRLGNALQNLDRASTIVKDALGIELLDGVSTQFVDAAKMGFEKRHPITHNLGVVDRKFLNRVRSGESLGRELRVLPDEVYRRSNSFRKLSNDCASACSGKMLLQARFRARNVNEYTKDAATYLAKAARAIEATMTREAVADAALAAAVGLEKLLKGILYDLNPLYVLKKPEFDNSVSLVYLARVLQSAIKGKDIAASPNADVLSFRAALARAKVVSLAANQHLHLQMKLAEARDTILHKTLAEFDSEALEVLLKRDLFPLINKYSEELDPRSGESTRRARGPPRDSSSGTSRIHRQPNGDDARRP
jgi:hypothetical protein